MNRGTLKDLELYQEDGQYYLKATYLVRKENDIYEEVCHC